jgi:hypothetical protein
MRESIISKACEAVNYTYDTDSGEWTQSESTWVKQQQKDPPREALLTLVSSCEHDSSFLQVTGISLEIDQLVLLISCSMWAREAMPHMSVTRIDG